MPPSNPHLERLLNHPLVGEVSQLVTAYTVHLHPGDRQIAVTVRVYYYPRQGKYLGEAGHSVWTKAQGGPYKDTHLYATPEEAAAEAILGMLQFYREDEPESIVSDEELERSGRQRPKP